jgi:sialic acid synthase SpsE
MTSKPPIGQKSKVVLEIGGNSLGSLELAARMLQAASTTGAWGVKFQAYRVKAFIHKGNPFLSELEAEEMDFSVLGRLVELAHGLSLNVGASVFDREGIELAERRGADFIKIASGDVNHLDLLRAAAASPLPLVLSTGASSVHEVDRAVQTAGRPLLALLQCTSVYPCPPDMTNLAVMDSWLKKGLPAGLSDHSEGIEASVLALQNGAVMCEKHFTTDRSLPGGDNSMSILPDEAKRLCGFESLPKADPRLTPYWGDPDKKPLPAEKQGLIRRFAVSARFLKKGKRLEPADLLFQRVGGTRLWGELLAPDEDCTAFVLKEDVPEDVVLSKVDHLKF